MRLRLICLFVLNPFLGGLAAPATADPSPIGRWWTQDHGGVIEIAPCGLNLCGRIVGQPRPRNPDGSRPMDIHGVPHCGLTILHDAALAADGQWHGRITNPDDGHDWRCSLWAGADGSLRLRGYLLVPLLGETQTWPKFTGTVAADCTIG